MQGNDDESTPERTLGRHQVGQRGTRLSHHLVDTKACRVPVVQPGRDASLGESQCQVHRRPCSLRKRGLWCVLTMRDPGRAVGLRLPSSSQSSVSCRNFEKEGCSEVVFTFQALSGHWVAPDITRGILLQSHQQICSVLCIGFYIMYQKNLAEQTR